MVFMTYAQLISEVERMKPEEQWAIFAEISRLLRQNALRAENRELGGVARVVARARVQPLFLDVARLKREDFYERR